MTFHYEHTTPNDKITILCLDDDFIVLKLLERDLTSLFDINLITSSSSNDVLKYLENHTVDLIIQDVIRPEINGWDFLRIIRSKERLKNIPVFFITNKTFDDTLKRNATELDATYITKPCAKSQLKIKILEILPDIALF